MRTTLDTHIKIGKSLLKSFSEYADEMSLDDEDEYFPILKIVINDLSKTYNGTKSEKDEINEILLSFTKNLYINYWLEQAIEDEDNPDIEMEKEEAGETFDDRYSHN